MQRPRFVASIFKENAILQYDSVTEAGITLEFTKSKTYVPRDGRSPTESWICVGCKLVRNHQPPGEKQKLPTIRVRQGELIDDPDNPVNPHFCDNRRQTTAKVVARGMKRDHRQTILQNANHVNGPVVCHQQMMRDSVAVIGQLTYDEETRTAIRTELPAYTEATRKCIQRALRKKFPALVGINNPPDIWNFLSRTWEAVNSQPGDRHENDLLVLHSQQNPPMIIFASPRDLDALYQTTDVIADGTFDYRPREFFPGSNVAQLYSLHGFVNREAVPMVVALLPNKNEETYTSMYLIVRNAVAARHNGDIGPLGHSRFHIDFELAARNGILAAFGRNTCIVGCLFHYSQALKKHIQSCGLSNAYNGTAPYDQAPFDSVKLWIRRLVGLALLPPELVMWLWNNRLQFIPDTGDATINNGLTVFRAYYQRQWLRSDDFIRLWNHYNNVGPRTNNHAEAWHRSLKDKFVSNPHMKLSTFMVEYQQNIHNQNQVRIDQLLQNQPPRPRIQRYIEKDNQIYTAKLAFDYNWLNHETLAQASGQDPLLYMLTTAENHVAYCGHLVGINEQQVQSGNENGIRNQERQGQNAIGNDVHQDNGHVLMQL